MFVASWLIGLPQRLPELHRNSFNAFSVILGLNCSALGSISRANLVNQTVQASGKHPSMGRQWCDRGRSTRKPTLAFPFEPRSENRGVHRILEAVPHVC